MSEEKTVLHVEDNPDNRLLVRRVLQAYGYHVVEAENAFKAREMLASSRPDLILMDINMPEIDGYTLTKEIKSNSHLKTIPILAVTANVMKGDRERSLQAGCDDYIEKPIDIDRFIDRIQQLIG